MLHSKTHASAVIRLAEKKRLEKNPPIDLESSSTSTSTGAPKQTTLMPMIRKLNAVNRKQLTRKFQLVHFNAVNCKSFRFYGKMAGFCHDTLKVRISLL